MKKRVLVIGSIAVVALAGVAAIIFAVSIRHGTESTSDEYGTVTVTRGNIQLTVPASGQLEPESITIVRPDSNMPTRKVVQILVAEGDAVSAGQAVVRIDDSGLELDMQSALASYNSARYKLDDLKIHPTADEKSVAESSLKQAQLGLESAQFDYDSTGTLVTQGFASKTQLVSSQKSLELAKANLDTARSNYNTMMDGTTADVMNAQEAAVSAAQSAYLKARLAYDSATIRTPVAGTVSAISVSVGDLIGPSSEVITVTENNLMLLKALVDEADIGSVSFGQKATISTYAYPNQPASGTVTQMSQSAATQGSVTSRTVTISLPNADGRLLWGMNADAEIVVLSARDVLTLPNSAITQSGGRATVLIRDGTDAVSWDVKVGANDGSKSQILAGLDEGDQVLVAKRNTASRPAQSGQQAGNSLMFRALR